MNMKFTAIRENHLYQKAYSKGKRFVTPALAVYVLPDRKREQLRRAHPLKIVVNRIGLTVSKKLGGSVVRSRTRRILREAYRQLDKQYGIKTGFLLVLAARQDATTMKSTEIAVELYTALSKLDMLKRK
jgi:ribonuclease P protein component